MTFAEEKERIEQCGTGIDERIKAVIFNEEEHSYWYNGKELHGVTGAISKILGKKFPDTDTVMLATMYGHDVHKGVEMWIKEGREPSTEGGKWVVSELKKFAQENDVVKYQAELLVSDFESTASCIDIVAIHKNGTASLFDIKTCSAFQRESFSLQLSVYKKLYEAVYGGNVTGLFVLGTKSQRAFRIIEQPLSKVDKILGMNKA